MASSSSNQYANRLLRNMSANALALIGPGLEATRLNLHQSLREPGEKIDYVYFPESGVISLVSPMLNGHAPELASVGREGLVGCVAAVGSHEAYSRWLVQVPGTALRCPAKRLERAFDENAGLRQYVVCYLEAFLTQTMQSVACNAIHPVEARCARWILMMRDRSDQDELPLTQEFLAEMLSVHRSSVVLANRSLQNAGFIRQRRGTIAVIDREGLEEASCECYRMVRNRFEALLPGTFR
ncbi:Crp/Fnr family transcriptional regulator [Microbaculum marinum]|uniref:Crp/Fnr family transcriptional regulator n=1 Tax=Microbaculum marinum TaxID=1764581 RepID=A0AAW9RMB1_9HYPH